MVATHATDPVVETARLVLPIRFNNFPWFNGAGVRGISEPEQQKGHGERQMAGHHTECSESRNPGSQAASTTGSILSR